MIRDRAVDSLLKFSIRPVCERLTNGALGEPLNMASALAVSLIACAALVVWFRDGRRDMPTLILCLLAILVGVGGYVFHGEPSSQMLMFEVLPPVLFSVLTFTLVLRRMFGFDPLVTVLHMVGFVLVAALLIVVFPVDALGGGARYLAPLLALYIAAGALIIQARLGMHEDRMLKGAAASRSDAVHFPKLKAGYGLLQAGMLLAVALVARAIDLRVCDQVPMGLHFLWHVFGAMSAGKLLFLCIRFPVPEQPEPKRIAA